MLTNKGSYMATSFTGVHKTNNTVMQMPTSASQRQLILGGKMQSDAAQTNKIVLQGRVQQRVSVYVRVLEACSVLSADEADLHLEPRTTCSERWTLQDKSDLGDKDTETPGEIWQKVLSARPPLTSIWGASEPKQMLMSGHEVYEVGNPPAFNQRTQQTAVSRPLKCLRAIFHAFPSAARARIFRSSAQAPLQNGGLNLCHWAQSQAL